MLGINLFINLKEIGVKNLLKLTIVLLVIAASFSACNKEKDILINAEKKYIYKINVISCGTCEKYSETMNWVLIPKIEDDFTVEFVVTKKDWNNGR